MEKPKPDKEFIATPSAPHASIPGHPGPVRTTSIIDVSNGADKEAGDVEKVAPASADKSDAK